MIDEKHLYRTRKGNHEVRFYSMDAGGKFPLHGAIKIQGNWLLMCWSKSGHCDPIYSMTDGTDWDLVKIRPQPFRNRVTIILSQYPMPLPQRILTRFIGKRVRLSIEEI